MKFYSDKYKLYEFQQEFEVLNELCDASKRSDSNCLYHTRFLFEMDETPLEEQIEIGRRVKSSLMRATFSGSKSIHFIVEFDASNEEWCKNNYKVIWHSLNKMLFESKADTACSNPSRLTRTPNFTRASNNVVQKLLFTGTTIMPSRDLLRKVHSTQCYNYAKILIDNAKYSKMNNENRKTNDNLCANYEVIQRYITTPFLKTNGNLYSSKWLFAAVKCCQKYNDRATLERVLNKARNENWTENEINRICQA